MSKLQASTSTVGETAQLSVSVHVCQMLATVFSGITLGWSCRVIKMFQESAPVCEM